jgi:hypothetical protein
MLSGGHVNRFEVFHNLEVVFEIGLNLNIDRLNVQDSVYFKMVCEKIVQGVK